MDVRNPGLLSAIIKSEDVDSQEKVNMKISCGQGSSDFLL